MLPTRWGSNLQPPNHQLDLHPTEPLRPAIWRYDKRGNQIIMFPYFSMNSVSNEIEMFVCVEVLRPSQPNGVMSSAVEMKTSNMQLIRIPTKLHVVK